ncbi:MAG: hypothetical protein JSV17_17115 [Candidatus Aminicenantes bacterium]|nr:MAG: hypothetical protein JSV17_17115 [Candidatus Aminicenantes bacterium]
MKKWALVIIAIFFGCSLLLSQDLVEAAKKEKERRTKLKKKSTIVVTNADLHTKERPKTPRIAPPEKRSTTVQRSVPQKTQRTVPTTPPRPIKRISTQQIENLDQIDLSVDNLDQLETHSISREFATQVLGTTQYVENSQMALDKPDGKHAKINEFGSLDLEIDIKNKTGDDIAIYAKRQKEGHQNENRNYGVFVEYRGEWEFIGFGGGITSPETFDLGEIPSTKKIRLLFKDFTQSMWTAKPYQQQNVSSSMGIDAVQCLHK